MKNTLIVSYTPREGSYTKQLVDHFIAQNVEKTVITHVELSENTPDLLLKENLNLYAARNFGGVELSAEQTEVLAKNDAFAQQLLEADYVVLATPMYNFSLPATVKAWFDAVIQAGVTFAPTPEGLKGLCQDTEALVLSVSGSDFGIEPLSAMNHATTLASSCFGLVGIPSKVVTAFGSQQYADRYETILADVKLEIDAISDSWY